MAKPYLKIPRKILIIAFITIFQIFSSCQQKCQIEIVGQWKVCHIIHNEEEILSNNFKENNFVISYFDSGIMNITNDELFYKLNSWKREKAFVKVDIGITQEGDNCYVFMQNPTFEYFNGKFTIIKSLVNVRVDLSEMIETRIILKSDDTTIYLSRFDFAS